MGRFRLLNFRTGVSQKTNREYAQISLMSMGADSRKIADFFVEPAVLQKALQGGAKLDSVVYISVELDDSLHYQITDIRPATTSSVKAD